MLPATMSFCNGLGRDRSIALEKEAVFLRKSKLNSHKSVQVVLLKCYCWHLGGEVGGGDAVNKVTSAKVIW